MAYHTRDDHPLPYGAQPDPPYAPRYVMLSDNHNNDSLNLRPPPYRRNLPRYYSKRSSDGKGCLCGCMCWCCCFLLLFLLFIAATLLYFYITLNPQVPSYSVDHLGIGAFDVRPDFSLYTEFDVTVRAVNPNKAIGISYGKGGNVAVVYKKATLCSGNLPVFYQGFRNTTVMKVVLRGESAFGSGLQAAMMENRQTGSIPLDIFVKVPVRLRVDGMEIKKVTVMVDCSLVVDSLSPNKKVGIKKAEYKVNVEF